MAKKKASASKPAKKTPAHKTAVKTAPKPAAPVKKKGKALSILLLSLLAVVLIAGGLYFFTFVKVSAPVKISDGVWSAKQTFVSYFILSDGKEQIVIDTGLFPAMSAKQLKKIGFDSEKVSAVFLTHSDKDHTGGVSAFKNAKIYLPAEEVQMINGTTKRIFKGKAHYNKLDVKYTTFKNAQTITVGKLKVKGIATPGHTPGSMCFLVNGKDLFIGDLAMLKDGVLVLMPKGYNNDDKLAEKSIKALAMIGKKAGLIATAHSGFTLNTQKAFPETK